MVNLQNYYSGGYFLIRMGRPDWKPPFGEFLPDYDLMSLSNCICEKRLSLTWGWIPGDKQAALDFGIRENQWAEFVDWCGTGYLEYMDVFSMFYSPDGAREFIKRFDLDTDNLFIIGAGLPQELQNNWAGEDDNEGVVKHIQQKLSIEPTNTILGFDVISYSYTDLAHSWLCSGLEKDMNNLFNIRTNEIGLLNSFDDAKKIYDWIAEDELKGTRAEPEPYDFWLLTSYPIEPAAVE